MAMFKMGLVVVGVVKSYKEILGVARMPNKRSLKRVSIRTLNKLEKRGLP